MTTALAKIEKQGRAAGLNEEQSNGFDFSELRIFNTVPPHHYDVVVMRGLVVVYDHECVSREGIQMGKLYVRENQSPPSAMAWEAWLKHEWSDRKRRHGPVSRLRVRREVVQALPHPRQGGPCLRLDSGHVDGPYHEWAFGLDIVGKVVGVYQPGGSKDLPNETS